MHDLYAKIDDAPKTNALRAQEVKNQESDRKLKERYATFILWGLGIQLLLMNVIFILKGFNCIELSDTELSVFTGATLLEIFGVITIITTHLFPRRCKN